jgi:hypothetical protein
VDGGLREDPAIMSAKVQSRPIRREETQAGESSERADRCMFTLPCPAAAYQQLNKLSGGLVSLQRGLYGFHKAAE